MMELILGQQLPSHDAIMSEGCETQGRGGGGGGKIAPFHPSKRHPRAHHLWLSEKEASSNAGSFHLLCVVRCELVES